MCSMNNTTPYVGVISNLAARMAQHKEKIYPNSFTAKYNCIKLVYYNWFDTILEAIAEEKRIKAITRKRRQNLQPPMKRNLKQIKKPGHFLHH